MIQGHNDIAEPVFVDFNRQLYYDLVRPKNWLCSAPTPAELPDKHPAEQ